MSACCEASVTADFWRYQCNRDAGHFGPHHAHWFLVAGDVPDGWRIAGPDWQKIPGGLEYLRDDFCEGCREWALRDYKPSPTAVRLVDAHRP